jgi:hypothetical protein
MLIPIPELKITAAEVAEEMKAAGSAVSGPLRGRFITVRANLFQRGIYDPVLVRFDSATAPKASVEEIATQLEAVAASL